MKPVRLRRGIIAVLVHVYSNGTAPSEKNEKMNRSANVTR
jgi:hypothetical protein